MLPWSGVLVFALAYPVFGEEVRITYLANEGVLIAAGDKKVLVDALFRDSLEDYSRHSQSVQEQMETGKPPSMAFSWPWPRTITLTTGTRER